MTKIELTNFKSHESTGPLDLGQITVFVGANNAGKSAILQAIFGLQQQLPLDWIRLGQPEAVIMLWLEDFGTVARAWELPQSALPGGTVRGRLTPRSGWTLEVSANDVKKSVSPLPGEEPHHGIVPFLGKRKVGGFNENVTKGTARTVRADLAYLAARLSAVSNSSHPMNARYAEACRDVLGFTVTSVLSESGGRPGVFLDDGNTLPIDVMGEGVPQVAGLLVELLTARQRVFLIEELENDLHPEALKRVLDLIVASAGEFGNQFLFSTHSHVVTRHMGGIPGARLYEVRPADRSNVPGMSIVEEVVGPEARLRVLRDLGYEVSDFELWSGWLILEESSAEKIVGSFLIPWFCPGLQGRLRTLAAGGTGKVKGRVEAFQRMFLYAHLEPVYRNRAWVIVDGDQSGRAVIAELQEMYRGSWSEEHFQALLEPLFENYYPPRFAEVREAITTMRNKREAKRELLEQVVEWCGKEPEAARDEFAESAAEVIRLLQEIEQALA